jgi:low affinity Fe/Cu permease
MGRDGPDVPIFGHLATRHKYGHDHRYVPNGFPNSEPQNRDGAAIQVKLDELIRVSAAKNFFVGIEHLTDEEIERLRGMCETRARGANKRVAQVEAKAEQAADRAG